MTEKRPVPLQHYFLFKEKLYLVKDSGNLLKDDVVKKVLKSEADEFYASRNMNQ
jgi:hypothetical protein